MGKGGFTVIEQQTTGSYTAGEDWLSEDFQLPDDYPDDVMTFLQLDFELDAADTIVTVEKNGVDYVINNGQSILGVGFRSFAITKNDIFQFKCNQNQTVLQFTLALEG